MWTCIECEFKYSDDNGDSEERMCDSCLYSKDTEKEKLLEAFEGYVNHLREMGNINDLWNNFDKETKEAVRVLITEIGKGRKD